MKRALFSLLLLTLTYALVLASFEPADLLLGAAVSGALLFVFRGFIFGGRPAPLPGLLGRIFAFGPFAAVTLWEVIVGTWEVALVTLHLRPLESPGIVAVPIGERTPVGITVSALVTTLSPGAFLVDVDWEKRVMLIHSINAGDPEAVRRSHQDFYQRYQRKVFP